MLLFGYIQVPGHFRVLGNPEQKDFIDILERKGIKIGIASMGDYERKSSTVISTTGDNVQDLINYLHGNGCNKIICACNLNLPNAITFIKTNLGILLSKSTSPVLSEHRIKNGEDAEIIYKLI